MVFRDQSLSGGFDSRHPETVLRGGLPPAVALVLLVGSIPIRSTTFEREVSMARSWAPEVVVDRSGKFYGNALRFPTKEEAEANVQDLHSRWMLVSQTRVVESEDEPNYNWVDGKLVAIKKPEEGQTA